MLFFHEIHELIAGQEAELEAAYRDEWMPLLAEGDDARLLWYWTHARVSSRANNVITVTAVHDASAWGRLVEEMEGGRLAAWTRRVDALRRDVSGCILLPSRWSKLQEIDFATVSADPAQRHEVSVYVEDTVWPPSLDDYVAYCGEHWFRPTTDGTAVVRAQIEMPAFLHTAEGTGRRPEVYLVQRLTEPARVFVNRLLATDYPPEMRRPEHYFVRGLAVRDQWESKIVRTAAWSPLS